MSINVLCVLLALLLASTYGFFPMWKNLLTHHRHWDGRYTYRNGSSSLYNCSLYVAALGDSSFLILTAEHLNIDLTIDPQDDTTIHLHEEAVWSKDKYFQNHTDIKISGQFVSDHQYYIFLGNVSSAEEENFATMALRPRGFLSTVTRHEQSHLNYGLVYGIPLSCAAVLMICGMLIIYWSMRKGYIRSLSWSYKNFHNSPEESSAPEPALKLSSRDEPESVA
ncbi:hypothetical protein EGW08_012503 [Elysia chlorotica]|uniref:Uncharacterized protein n=1 Tax=Elysia chlorotica TaxID=188477 RepID=A0A3S1HHX9_ELYCH|nr:hypothetical protein EGW08_012503 [Elysia chlorotica]